MMQKMPWDEDWSQATAPTAGGYPTITIPRDPRQVQREDAATQRAIAAEQRANDAAARDRDRFNERNKPTLPAGYMMGPDGKTAVRIPGLPPEKNAPAAQSDDDKAAIRAEALDKIKLARSLKQRSRDGWFATGIGASTMGSIGGTGAYDVFQDTETLKNAGALTRIMEMARTNGGKNPLTPLSNADFQALASSLSNLNTSQSDSQYQANVQRVEDLYARAYAAAGGADLEGDLGGNKKRKADAPVVNLGATNPPGSTPPPPGAGPQDMDRSTKLVGGGPMGGNALATGETRTEIDKEATALVTRMVYSNASVDEINAALNKLRPGTGNLNPAEVQAARDYRRKDPKYNAVSPVTREVPTTAWEQFASSPTGTGIYAAVDAGLGGLTDEIAAAAGGGDLADLNARKQAAFATNPKAAFAGQVVGTVGSMATLGGISRTAGLSSRLANPQLAGDVAFGAFSGAGQNNDNRLLGATLGGAGGAAGNYAGRGLINVVGAVNRTRPVTAMANRTLGMFGRGPVSRARPLNPAESTAYSALNRAGVDDVTQSLNEAQSLGLPMSLADTNPNLRELAGAAVRRSPSASAYAEDMLIPRSRGQYDRFVGAVERDLGPTTNIPQRSAELGAQARTASRDLYDRAYSNPVPSTPEMISVLDTPFGRQALGRARTIAANERRSPDELGFAQDAQGNVVLNPRPNRAIADHLSARAELDAAQDAYRAARNSPTIDLGAARTRVEQARANLRTTEAALKAAPDPSIPANVPAYTTQTLDYVKRGMDDVLEEQRNPITGRLMLDEAGRAQNGVRGQLLSEVDRLNPDYAAARSAYAGPASSREALHRGGEVYGLHPDELALGLTDKSPEHLMQMQLGYRGALVDHASKVRDASNPWDATLGSPMARTRLSTMYPDTPGVDRLVRSAEVEKQMQQTTNAVLGNSRTARNQIADQAFAGNPMVEGALHAGAAVATHGASLPGTAARIAGTGIRDRFALGIGKRAEAKADALAPILLNPDPAVAIANARRLLAQQEEWRRAVEASKPKRLGMFGGAFGGQAATIPLNY